MTAAFARRFADANRETLVALCAALVAAPSAQPQGDTSAAAAAVAGFLAQRGLEPEIRSGLPSKSNVVCVLKGARPGPHLVLNGHLDTLAPGDEADWSVPLWTLGRAHGRLTGLGIGNMKAGSAALALALAGLAERRETLAGRVTLTLVADEVVFGPDGAQFLLASDPDLHGDWLINAEGPGGMDLAVAEKGLLWLEIEAAARPGQGMLATRASTATARLARVLAEIDDWNEDHATPPPELADVAPPGLRLSVNAGALSAEGFVSQVAPLARARVDLRVPPGMTIDEIEARVRSVGSRVGGVETRRIKGWDPNWTAAAHPLCQTVGDAALAMRGARPRPTVRLPASDAARWRARGVPAVSYGPQPELASGVDDYVNEDDAVDCLAVYIASALALLGGARD